MYSNAVNKTYLVTLHGENGVKTFSISGLEPDDIERLLARKVGDETGVLQYRVVEKTQTPLLSTDAVAGLGNATMIFAATLVATGLLQRPLHKWLQE